MNKDAINSKEVKKSQDCKWFSYNPRHIDSEIIGISSNYRCFEYKGVKLWVGTASATNTTDSIPKWHSECGQNRHEVNTVLLWTITKEAELCKEMSSKSDFVLIDGSIHSRLAELGRINKRNIRSKNDYDLLKFLYGSKNVIFVSTIPNSKTTFGYTDFDIATRYASCRNTGFSMMCKDDRYGSDSVVTTMYAHLEDWSPLLRMEMFGDDYDESRTKGIIDCLTTTDLTGYPHALWLAQSMCKIDKSDIMRLTRSQSKEIRTKQVLA